jgi:hypothetical protein
MEITYGLNRLSQHQVEHRRRYRNRDRNRSFATVFLKKTQMPPDFDPDTDADTDPDSFGVRNEWSAWGHKIGKSSSGTACEDGTYMNIKVRIVNLG